MSVTTVNLSDQMAAFVQKVNTISTNMGDVDALTTRRDSDVVSAINGLDSDMFAGMSLQSLATTNKTIIGAINEISDGLDSNSTTLATLTGDQQTVARAAVSASGDLSYNQSTGVFSIDVEQVYTKANFDSDLGDASTSDLPEGTNLYYTNARADARAQAKLNTPYIENPASHHTYTVTVATKTTAHPYTGQGSSSAYFLNGAESPSIILAPNQTYRFDQSDNSNNNHPLKFYLEADRTTNYTTGVTVNGVAGQAGSYTQIVVSEDTPIRLYYQCQNHSYMGSVVSSLSGNAAGAISVTASTGLSYNSSTGVIAGVNATTNAKGVASFSSTNFSTSNGAVSIKNDGVARANLKDEVALIIYNSSGVAVKTLYGAGS